METTEVLWLDAEGVREALPPAAAVEAAARALVEAWRGTAEVPLRLNLRLAGGGSALVMPASAAQLAVKVVSVVPGNAERGLPGTQGVVLLLDGATGSPRALLDGTVLTGLRTGGAAAAAARALAPRRRGVLAMIGSGTQAAYQVACTLAVLELEEVRLWSPHRKHAERLRARVERLLPPGALDRLSWRIASRAEEAVRGADLVVCATTAREPVLEASWLEPDVHVNGVGSFTPEMRELPPELAARAAAEAGLWVEKEEAALAEAGELIAAVEAGLLEPASLRPLGALLAEARPGRRARGASFFKSVGVAELDLYAAQAAVEAAEARGLGRRLAWSPGG
ncbi:MAG: ornithine cyclodeaminase family protein [Firmicutes bacterium]|nr:ornithine cyclodeaminase family protein [Bacillota bacterium]